MTPAIALHLVAALVALLAGIAILARAKGTPSHRLLGRVWVGAMAATALSSFAITYNGHFSWIHALSAWTLLSLVMGVRAIRAGRLAAHRGWMLNTYAGLAIAGAFTLLPSRLIGRFFFAG
jgi:uncharacterized membrane protein